jgi:parvulin-like peptidyl-prolyl isomerase
LPPFSWLCYDARNFSIKEEKTMKHFLRASCAAALFGAAAAGHAVVVDEVVATVDTEVILRSDLENEIAPMVDELAANADSSGLQNELDNAMREALDRAIEQRIVYREAILAGASLDDDVLNDRIQRIQAQYGTADEFLKALEESGETMSDFRERVKKQTIAMAYAVQKRRQWEDQAVISDTQVRAYYDDHRAEFGSGARVQARRIFLGASSDSEDRARARARLEELRAQIEAGADFAEIARANSQGPEADAGGLVGWVSPGDLVPALEEPLFALSTGEITQVIETDFGFQILRAEAREDAGELSFEKARTMIEPRLRRQFAMEKYRNWITELRKRSGVRVFI